MSDRIQDFNKPSKDGVSNVGTHQGTFHPKNVDKYIGNVNQIYYRSGWELKYYQWLDREPNVIRYSVENIQIQYISPLDQRKHRYYIDVYAEIMMGDKKVKWLIEIKPIKYTLFPQMPKRKTKKAMENYYKNYNTTLVNIAKFKAALNYARNTDSVFAVVAQDKKTGLFKTIPWNETKIGINPVRE